MLIAGSWPTPDAPTSACTFPSIEANPAKVIEDLEDVVRDIAEELAPTGHHLQPNPPEFPRRDLDDVAMCSSLTLAMGLLEQGSSGVQSVAQTSDGPRLMPRGPPCNHSRTRC